MNQWIYEKNRLSSGKTRIFSMQQVMIDNTNSRAHLVKTNTIFQQKQKQNQVKRVNTNINKTTYTWNRYIAKFDIRDLHGNRINTQKIERYEQDLATKYIEENDVVLELGARYGSVSCIINSKLSNKINQVVVEPDRAVWKALELNKRRNKCEFSIVKGFVSTSKMNLTGAGYGSTFVENQNSTIPSYSLDEIKKQYNINFNVLVADCEGFLEKFFDENPDFYDNLRMIIFEADYPEKCNYDKIRANLRERNFTEVVGGFHNVWIKYT